VACIILFTCIDCRESHNTVFSTAYVCNKLYGKICLSKNLLITVLKNRTLLISVSALRYIIHYSLQQSFSTSLLQRNLPHIFVLLMELYAMIQVSILLSVINKFRPRQFRSVSTEPVGATRGTSGFTALQCTIDKAHKRNSIITSFLSKLPSESVTRELSQTKALKY